VSVRALVAAEGDLMRNIAEQQAVVISTRIRLARNIRDVPFPGRAGDAQRAGVLKVCQDAFFATGAFENGYPFELDSLGKRERALLIERHLISKELADGTGGAVFISRDQTCSVMVNEEDHLRIQVMRGGFQLDDVWKQASVLDAAIEKRLNIAFSSALGYLTACPTNLGTGLRGSAMLHLPGLVLSDAMDKVVRAVSHDGLTVRGWLGEGSEAAGSIFQISNQHTLGLSEPQILSHLAHWLKIIIEQEENARLRLLEDDPQRVFDLAARAVATLNNARLLPCDEAMGALSFARFACDIGMLPAFWRILIDRLLIENQPAHIDALVGNDLNARARDSFRALFVREALNRMPPLRFDILDAAKA